MEGLPTDIWFNIGVLLERYDGYIQLATALADVCPKLLTEASRYRARQCLIKCVKYNTHEFYILDDVHHRDDDLPAAVMYGGRVREWFRYGKRHRDNGLPAIHEPYRQVWYVDGVWMRETNRQFFYL